MFSLAVDKSGVFEELSNDWGRTASKADKHAFSAVETENLSCREDVAITNMYAHRVQRTRGKRAVVSGPVADIVLALQRSLIKNARLTKF